LVAGFKQGDAVTAVIGYTPNWVLPNCRNYKLLSLSR